jgi:hypothetical protein
MTEQLTRRPSLAATRLAAARSGFAVELSDRRCCEKLVARGRVLMTYVMQRDVAHVLPLRLSPRRICVADVLPPYFAIAARMTAKLRTNPLITMNFLDRS